LPYNYEIGTRYKCDYLVWTTHPSVQSWHEKILNHSEIMSLSYCCSTTALLKKVRADDPYSWYGAPYSDPVRVKVSFMKFPEPGGEPRTLKVTAWKIGLHRKTRYARQAKNACLQIKTVTTQTSHLCPPNETTPQPLRPLRASGHLFQKRSFPRTTRVYQSTMSRFTSFPLSCLLLRWILFINFQ
jgi:hypothetical protein